MLKWLGATGPRSRRALLNNNEPLEPDQPLVGMQRYFSGEPPYDSDSEQAVTSWLDAEKRVWSVSTAGPGRNTNAKKHGGFSRNKATVDSIIELLKEWS